jgi:coproporphyrinogen III oxidase-like Fe-S oxidoreductase
MNNAWFEQYGGDIKYQKIDDDTRALERIITGLRTIYGVALDDKTKNILDIDFIKNNNDLVQIKDNRLIATDKGILILDDLLVNLTR